jgi:hypothetical protein
MNHDILHSPFARSVLFCTSQSLQSTSFLMALATSTLPAAIGYQQILCAGVPGLQYRLQELFTDSVAISLPSARKVPWTLSPAILCSRVAALNLKAQRLAFTALLWCTSESALAATAALLVLGFDSTLRCVATLRFTHSPPTYPSRRSAACPPKHPTLILPFYPWFFLTSLISSQR